MPYQLVEGRNPSEAPFAVIVGDTHYVCEAPLPSGPHKEDCQRERFMNDYGPFIVKCLNNREAIEAGKPGMMNIGMAEMQEILSALYCSEAVVGCGYSHTEKRLNAIEKIERILNEANNRKAR